MYLCTCLGTLGIPLISFYHLSYLPHLVPNYKRGVYTNSLPSYISLHFTSQTRCAQKVLQHTNWKTLVSLSCFLIIFSFLKKSPKVEPILDKVQDSKFWDLYSGTMSVNQYILFIVAGKRYKVILQTQYFLKLGGYI